jgi:formylglycine-generating enzyme required for sulfatase activity
MVRQASSLLLIIFTTMLNLRVASAQIDDNSGAFHNQTPIHVSVDRTTDTQGPIGETVQENWAPDATQEVVVRFESEPPGALVMAGDRVLCRSAPCSRTMPVGNSTIIMKMERYLSKERSILVKNRMGPISFKLDPNFGWLTVESSPTGLVVTINGETAGKTPLTKKILDPNQYAILVTDPRYYDKGEKINLAAGEQRKISVRLKARMGAVKIIAQDEKGDDVAGELYSGGEKVGSIPGTHKLIIGKHAIEVKTKRGTWGDTVDVIERKVEAITAVVKEGAAHEAVISDGMARIPAGWFMIGCSPEDSECEDDENPSMRVYMDSFYMDVHEVTQEEYQACVLAGSCEAINESACYKWTGMRWGKGGGLNYSFKGSDQPVVCVSWKQARTYCLAQRKRLPTEAEWEYAARGGTSGSRYGNLDAIAWYKGNSDDKTHPVGRLQPNAYGLYDMLGNVWEWCDGWYDKDWYSRMSERNPVNRIEGSIRVLRGGGWNFSHKFVRVSTRYEYDPLNWDSHTGFRCSRD